MRTHLTSLDNPALFKYLENVQIPNNAPKTRYTIISAFIIELYGDLVANALRVAPCNISQSVTDVLPDFSSSVFPWLSFPKSYQILKLSHLPQHTLLNTLHNIPSVSRPQYTAHSKHLCSEAIYVHICKRTSYLESIDFLSFSNGLFSCLPFLSNFNQSHSTLIKFVLEKEYGLTIMSQIYVYQNQKEKKSDNEKEKRKKVKLQTAYDLLAEKNNSSLTWPQKVNQGIVFDSIQNYYNGSQWQPPLVCAICARQRSDLNIHQLQIKNNECLPLNLSKLHVNDPFILKNKAVNDFVYETSMLNGLMLERLGLSSDLSSLNACSDCHSSLSKNKMPRFALANNLYRGLLPEEFKDLTWVEEMVCAIYRNTAHVTRIFKSSDPSHPRILNGNTCAHEMNVISTASVLPRTPADINGMLSIVFVGPGKFDPKSLEYVFRVRKNKVWRFLLWLKAHNRLYSNIPLNESILDNYPDDDILPGLDDRVIYDHESDAYSIFSEETAGFSEHPAEAANNVDIDNNNSVCFLEKMGVSDPEGDRIKGRTFTASALHNLTSNSSSLPDLVLHRGFHAISEYHNPDLVPGMYPTLFPLGIGGFEDKNRETPIQFSKQAEYYLDLPDRSFRYHHSYIFVILNMIQRRTAHLHTHLTVKKKHFESVAKKLSTISPDIINDVANHLEHEGKYTDLSGEHKEVLDLLKHVNTVAAKIPGSHASKIFVRNEIRNYIAYFGVPQIYFTFNPSAVHSPIFQVMFGDKSVDLSDQFPKLVSSYERSLRLAQDPVAAADFFQFCVKSLFEYLFGWDFKKNISTKNGGILGRLQAFYGTTEFTERGSLHGHFVIWLVGGINPSELHERMTNNPEYQTQFFEFFDDIIHHHLPDIECEIARDWDPRIERPPPPPLVSTNIPIDILNSWNSVFLTEIKKCGEKLQRHQHGKVCHKYGNTGKCRFLFPHEIVEASYFDPDSNSVILMCRDSTINYFNPYILVFCRHNHDIKCILSGKAAKSAMFYITDYITKMDLKTYEILSLLSRAVSKMPNSSNTSIVDSAKTLLHKCLAQFTRQQQIHAQQAARYLRGFGDAIYSHKTVPMLSALLISNVKTFSSHNNHLSDIHNDGDYDNEDESNIEQTALLITTNKAGKIQETNQFHDYFFRSDSLAAMNFYDFCHCVRRESKTKDDRIINTPETRLGVLTHHSLKPGHPLSETHQLIEHTNETCGEGIVELIPRVVGMSIP